MNSLDISEISMKNEWSSCEEVLSPDRRKNDIIAARLNALCWKNLSGMSKSERSLMATKEKPIEDPQCVHAEMQMPNICSSDLELSTYLEEKFANHCEEEVLSRPNISKANREASRRRHSTSDIGETVQRRRSSKRSSVCSLDETGRETKRPSVEGILVGGKNDNGHHKCSTLQLALREIQDWDNGMEERQDDDRFVTKESNNDIEGMKQTVYVRSEDNVSLCEHQTSHAKIDGKEVKCQRRNSKTRKAMKSPEVKKPRRALSAYNFFFSYERARILGEPRYDLSSDRETARDRPHRKSHGKIGFIALAKEIGQRWRQLDPESKSFFEAQADEDKRRYLKEMEDYVKNSEQKGEIFSSFTHEQEKDQALICDTEHGGVNETDMRTLGDLEDELRSLFEDEEIAYLTNLEQSLTKNAESDVIERNDGKQHTMHTNITNTHTSFRRFHTADSLLLLRNVRTDHGESVNLDMNSNIIEPVKFFF